MFEYQISSIGSKFVPCGLGGRAHTDRQTDWNDDAKSRSRQFCEHT